MVMTARFGNAEMGLGPNDLEIKVKEIKIKINDYMGNIFMLPLVYGKWGCHKLGHFTLIIYIWHIYNIASTATENDVYELNRDTPQYVFSSG